MLCSVARCGIMSVIVHKIVHSGWGVFCQAAWCVLQQGNKHGDPRAVRAHLSLRSGGMSQQDVADAIMWTAAYSRLRAWAKSERPDDGDHRVPCGKRRRDQIIGGSGRVELTFAHRKSAGISC